MKREGIRPPKFAEQFAKIDFDAEPLPVLCMFPIPEPVALDYMKVCATALDGKQRLIPWPSLSEIPRVKLRVPIICQIFNWSEEVEWEGIRLSDFLDYADIETDSDGYYAIYSRDGHFFETLSRDEARDPRVLLATGLNGCPLPEDHGAPVRLVVPFLQGYKSVKWVKTIRAFEKDPIGIKRLRGQSRTSVLSAEWKEKFKISAPKGKAGDPK